MDRNLLALLILDTLTVVIGWAIYLSNVPPDTALFLFSSQTVLILGLISLGMTFFYSFFVGGRSIYFWPAVAVIVIGAVVVFFNWFAGGILILAAILLLIFSRAEGVGNRWGIFLVFLGFSILALLPPVEAMLNLSFSSLDIVIIAISAGVILGGLMISLRRGIAIESYLGYIALSLAFFLLPPYHEVLRIKSNGSYGMYDMAIIAISTILFSIFLFASFYALKKQDWVSKEIERGYDELRKGNWERAYSVFKALHKSGQIYSSVFNGMGVALMHMKRFDESEKYLREALRIRESDEYRTNLGNLYYRKGEINKAMEVYRSVLKRNPDCYLALNNLGRCLMRKGKIDEARRYLERAMEVNPNGTQAKQNYSMLKNNGK